MSFLTQQRCHNHTQREAVARCTECERMFCRECVTLHDDRMICNQCLNLKSKPKEMQPSKRNAILLLLLWPGCLLLLWFIFYGIGRILYMTPSQFHDGTYLPVP